MDASVFLPFSIPEETEHADAARFFGYCEAEGHDLLFPTLALAEVAGGVARRKRDSEKASVAVSRLKRLAGAHFFPLTVESAESAGLLAQRYFLRGADAVYCQLAQEKRRP